MKFQCNGAMVLDVVLVHDILDDNCCVTYQLVNSVSKFVGFSAYVLIQIIHVQHFCMLMVSGLSGLFQGMLKSPEMRILFELLNKMLIWSGNSFKKVSIVIGVLVEYGAL